MSLHILYIFPEPLPLTKARGIQVVNTVHALARQGVKVDLAYVPVSGAPDPFIFYGLKCPENVTLVPLSRSLPWPLHRLRAHSNRLFVHRLSAWFKLMQRKGRAPQLIMARHLKIAHQWLARFPQIPLLFEAHEIFAENAPRHKQAALHQLEKQVLANAEGVIAITHGVAQSLKERYGLAREMPIVPSGASLPAVNSAKDWSKIGRRIVYAGSLYEWKGAQDLVAAAKWLSGFKITLLGGETDRIRQLQQVAPRTGAEIEFVGHLPHNRVIEELGCACIAVLPNRAGSVSAFTSPLKLFEYMAAGCAIVACDLPVFREVLGEDEAVWVEPGNPEALAAGIRILANNPQQAKDLGAHVRQLATHFTWEARASLLIKTANGIIDEA